MEEVQKFILENSVVVRSAPQSRNLPIQRIITHNDLQTALKMAYECGMIGEEYAKLEMV